MRAATPFWRRSPQKIISRFSRHLHGRHQRHRDGAHPAPGRPRPAAGVRDLVPGIRMGRVPRPPLRLSAQALPEEKLFQLADELRRVLFRAEPELEVRIARQQVHLPLRKIQYAMAQNHYVRIVSDDGECRTVSTFSQVEQLLRAQENFIVCNRGVILNMDKVLRLDSDCFEMLDAPACPCARRTRTPCSPSSHNISSAICGGSYDAERRPDLGLFFIWTLFSGPRRLLPGNIPLPRAPVGACEGPPAHRCAGSRSRHSHLPCGGGLCAIFELDSNLLLLPTCWRRSGCCAGGWGRKFP